MNYDYYKYHGLGNDYIVIDPQKFDITLTPAAIKLICHRNFGIGSDGILYGPMVEVDGFRLRIFNPDGSEAEKSGNGIRIFSRYLFDAGYVKSSRFQLYTQGGQVLVELLDDSAHMIRADMGSFTFHSPDIPAGGPAREIVGEELLIQNHVLSVTCLSIGNPHCVIPLPDISRQLAEEVGPAIENHPLFPNRINVQLLKVLDRKTIQIEIWERGAGYTLASGSSSCAAAAAAYRLGLVDQAIDVHMPGGHIQVIIDDNGRLHMTGPVAGVCQGHFSHDFREEVKKYV